MSSETTAISTIFARAALAGNPSDGYGGAVLAVPIGGLFATVRMTRSTVDGIREIDGPTTTADHGVARLIGAAQRRFAAVHGVDVGPVHTEWSTTIPKSVGLAGSSALVTATLAVLAALAGVEVSARRRAAMALAVEHEDLGIVAGPQDRLVQAEAKPLLMHFDVAVGDGMGRYRAVEGPLVHELYVAWSPEGAAPSGALHGDLRSRWMSGEHRLRQRMATLAATAGEAALALEAGDRKGLDRAIDESMTLRAEVVDVDPTTSRLAAVARSVGASANSAGSGGSVAGRCDGDVRGALVAALGAVGASCVFAEKSGTLPP